MSRTIRDRARGEYRPIYTVLVDGPDYQRLEPDARHVFLITKLSLGAAGIGVLYPGQLVARTGLPEPQVATALARLDEAGWVKQERNVVWVVDGLRHEPSIRCDNPNHRRYIQRHVGGLPHLAILDAFRQRYADWFADSEIVSESHREPIANPSQTPSKPSGISGSKGGVGERRAEPTGFAEAWSAYPKREGSNSRQAASRAYAARLREGVPAADLIAGVHRYRAYCEARGIIGGPFVQQASTFFGPAAHYAESWELAGRGRDDSPHAMNPDEHDAYLAAEDARVREGQARRDAERAGSPT